MMPILLSVPHGGLKVPDRFMSKCLLTPEQIEKDGDVGASVIYSLKKEVQAFVTTEVARAVLDMNREEGDLRSDGIVKTHTCWSEPVWKSPLTDEEYHWLLKEHYRPYHRRLTDLANKDVVLGVDGHTMAVHGPPVGPDPGVERPAVCLSNADGTCPESWIKLLADCFRGVFEGEVAINRPFRGGYITRTHSNEMPWVQIELSRTAVPSLEEKRERVHQALARWCDGFSRLSES